MHVAHIPDDLYPLLQMEALVALDMVARHSCDAIVELGCYDGRALEAAKAARIAYYGIDIDRDAIAILERRIANEHLPAPSRALVGDVTDCSSWADQIVSKHPLQLIPFNLLGNLAEPAEVFTSLSLLGGLAVVSLFNDAPKTTGLRRRYYSACGIDPLEEAPGRYGGTLFTGGRGFRSQSFSPTGIRAMLREAGLKAVAQSSNQVGSCITVNFE